MAPSEDEARVAELFRRMGAEGEAAETMARQLLKRAAQIADERGITQVEALSELLQRVIQGREGVAPRSGSEEEGGTVPER